MMFNIDNAATYRVLAVLKLLIDEPHVHTRKSVSENFKISLDTFKKYIRVIRAIGFDVKHSGYPDYTYYIDNIQVKYTSMKITKEFLSKEFSNRHISREDLKVSVSMSYISLHKIFVEYSNIRSGSKIDFEIDDTDSSIYLIVKQGKGDFSVSTTISGNSKVYRINDKMLSAFLFKHFHILEKKTFKLILNEVEQDKFKLMLK